MKMHMVICLFSCVTCPFISFSHCVLIFSNINLNRLSYMLALCWKKSRCKKFEKRRTKLFSCLAVVRLSSLPCVSGDGEGSTSACPVPSLLGSHQSLDSNDLAFQLPFTMNRKIEWLSIISALTVCTSFTRSLLLLMSISTSYTASTQ